MTDNISKKMNVSKSNAERLVRTESAAYASKAKKQSFIDLEVEKFEVVATLDTRTSEICQNMDGKVFDMKDYEVGVTAPPYHINCRSTTAPYFEDEEEDTRAARNPETGKTEYVPANMKYKEREEKFLKDRVEKEEKSGITGIKEYIKPTEEIKQKYEDEAFKIFGYEPGDGELTKEEVISLKRYTGDEYKKINPYLRGEIKDDMIYDNYFNDYYGLGNTTLKIKKSYQNTIWKII